MDTPYECGKNGHTVNGATFVVDCSHQLAGRVSEDSDTDDGDGRRARHVGIIVVCFFLLTGDNDPATKQADVWVAHDERWLLPIT